MRVLVTGATGLLGGWLIAALTERKETVLAYGGPRHGLHGLDLTDAATVSTVVASARPNVVIHAAALSSVADCTRDPTAARRINVDGTANVARACIEAGARLVHLSTDLVFDGEHGPYSEEATPAPLSVYGRTKLDAEHEATTAPDSVVVRVSLLFGPTRTARRGFFDQQLDALVSQTPIRLFDDEWRTPLSLRAAAEALVAIARADVRGLVHLGGPERLSRYEMGVLLAHAMGIAPERSITRVSRTSIAGEPRPRDVSLDSASFRAAFPGMAAESFSAECERFISDVRGRAPRCFP